MLTSFLLGFLVKRVLAAELAVFVHFKSVGIVLFVFGSVVVSLFAFRACQNYFILTHVGTSLIICLPFMPDRIRFQSGAAKAFFTPFLSILRHKNKAPLRKVEPLYHNFKEKARVFFMTM